MAKKRVYRKRPLISVVMPVYNAADFLDEAISSILNQTYTKFELIIIDDASTDTSRRIIGKYRRRFPRKIRTLYLKSNLNNGGDSCANHGVAMARGEYVARMDADDVANPRRLEKQLSFLERHEEVFMVGSNAQVIDRHGNVLGLKTEPRTNEEIKKSFFTFNPIIHPSVMFRTYFANKMKFRYQIVHSANNDYYTFFKLSCQGALFHNLQENLMQMRIHDHNDTFVNIKQKFTNTLKTRIEMVVRHGYRPNVIQIGTSVIQAIVVYTMPESIIRTMYLVSKGIISFTDLLKKPAGRLAKIGG